MVVAGALAIAATAWFGRDLSQLTAQPVVFGLAYLGVRDRGRDALRRDPVPPVGRPAGGCRARDRAADPDRRGPGLAGHRRDRLDRCIGGAAGDRPRRPNGSSSSPSRSRRSCWPRSRRSSRTTSSTSSATRSSAMPGSSSSPWPSLGPDAWAPARTWILAFVVARSAFAAWVAGIRAGFWTGRVGDLRGWALRSPILTVAFGLVVVASVGFPGLAAFDARTAIVEGALPSPFSIVALLATLAPIGYYGRLLVIGLSRPDRILEPDDAWRPVIKRVDRHRASPMAGDDVDLEPVVHHGSDRVRAGGGRAGNRERRVRRAGGGRREAACRGQPEPQRGAGGVRSPSPGIPSAEPSPTEPSATPGVEPSVSPSAEPSVTGSPGPSASGPLGPSSSPPRAHGGPVGRDVISRSGRAPSGRCRARSRAAGRG